MCAGGKLLAKACFGEPDAPVDTAVELAAELQLMARWLELDEVVVSPAGDLAADVRAAIRGGGGQYPL